LHGQQTIKSSGRPPEMRGMKLKKDITKPVVAVERFLLEERYDTLWIQIFSGGAHGRVHPDVY